MNTSTAPASAPKPTMVERALEAVKAKAVKKFDLALNDLVEAHGVDAARKVLVASDQRIATKA